MNQVRPGAADVATAIELAERKYRAWHIKKSEPDLMGRVEGLSKEGLIGGAWALARFRIHGEVLKRRVLKRIQIYKEVARETPCREMLSAARLEELRQRISTSTEASCDSLRRHIEDRASTAGDFPHRMLPSEFRYRALISNLGDLTHAELQVLEAEGRVGTRDPNCAVQQQEAAEFAPSQPAPLTMVYDARSNPGAHVEATPGPLVQAERPECTANVHPSADEISGPMVDGAAVESDSDGVRREREMLIQETKRIHRTRTGEHLNDAAIANLANKKWNDATQVRRWKRNDPRVTKGDALRIEKALRAIGASK